eukprot:3153130-Pyramimonas_sp.AAC.1
MSSGRSLIQSLKSTSSGIGCRSSMAFVFQRQMHNQVRSICITHVMLDSPLLEAPGKPSAEFRAAVRNHHVRSP